MKSCDHIKQLLHFYLFINRVSKDSEEVATLPDGWMKSAEFFNRFVNAKS